MKERMKLFVCALFIASSVCCVGESLQSHPLWGNLESGPETVGFKALWIYDYSRTWKEETDFEGRRVASNPFRPMRISVWYPAQKRSGDSPMLFRNYIYLQPEEESFHEFNKRQEDFEIGGPGHGIRGFFKSDERFESLLKTTMSAFQNAAIKKSKFPLIVYSLGQNDYTQENIILFEYLASHGYVIATVPHLGTSPRRFHLYSNDPLSYEAQVRDLEFVIQTMQTFPNVDPQKIASMGMSQGGVYALLLAMRHSEIDAVIALDSYLSTQTLSYEFKYWEAPYFDAGRTRAPLLFLHRGGTVKYDVAESLKFSDRYFVTFPRLTHGDFNSTPMIVLGSPVSDIGSWIEEDIKVRNQETGAFGHQVIARYVLNYLEAILKGDLQGHQFITNKSGPSGLAEGFVEYRFEEGLKGPTEEEYYTLIIEKGLDAAIDVFRKVKERYPDNEPIREKILNRIGNELIWAGKPAQAIEVFKLNVEAHSDSSNVYENLAEGYQAMGNIKPAIENYEKTLELDPQNQGAAEALKKRQEKK